MRIGYGDCIGINSQFMVHRLLHIRRYLNCTVDKSRLCKNTKRSIRFLASVICFSKKKKKVSEIRSVSSLRRRGGEVPSLFLRIRRAIVQIWTWEFDSSYYVGSNHITSCLSILPPEDRNALVSCDLF